MHNTKPTIAKLSDTLNDRTKRGDGIVWAKLKQAMWELRGVWIGAPSLTVLILVLRLSGVLQPLEWGALDWWFRLRPAQPTDTRITIVGINESDIERIGTWPASDAVIARLISRVKQYQPRAIGLDLYRNLPVEPGHAELVKVFESTPNLIGIEKKVSGEDGSAIAPPPALAKKGQVGVNDVVVDADGRIRRGLLFLTTPDGQNAASLGLILATLYLDREGIIPESGSSGYMKLGSTVFKPFEASDGGYVRADAAGYQILLNFRGGHGSFPTVSMTDVLEDRVDPQMLRDRIVLIGPTAASLKDIFYTPYSSNTLTTVFTSPDRTYGVEIQANLISHILGATLDGRTTIKVWSQQLEGVWIFVWTSLGATLSWTLRFRRWSLLLWSLALGILIGSSYILFLFGWWIPVVPPLLGMGGAAIASIAYIAHTEYQDRQLVMNLFGRHVTSNIADAIWQERHQLLQEGRLLGRKVTATVLFTDIKDFSSIAEQIDPEQLMSWLNEYMGAMAEIVLAHEGVIDKFIGDSVMAVFGVPFARESEEEIARDALAAVQCACEMEQKLRSLNQTWQSRGQPIIAMRVGISTGPVVIGSLGNAQREDYTTIGDSVNVAARLESYDKSIDGGLCRILMSEQTYQYVEEHVRAKLLGRALLRGRGQPIAIYQVCNERSALFDDNEAATG